MLSKRGGAGRQGESMVVRENIAQESHADKIQGAPAASRWAQDSETWPCGAVVVVVCRRDPKAWMRVRRREEMTRGGGDGEGGC